MARIVTVANNKGGCGKTTTAVNLAAALSLRGYDILVIDLDAQANLSESLRIEPAAGGSAYDALKSPSPGYVPPVRKEWKGGALDVIPSVRDLAAVEAGLSTAPDRLTRLASWLFLYRPKYDFILIDTPPSTGVLSIAALYAADAAIITLQPEYLAVQGLAQIRETLEALRNAGAHTLDANTLVTLYDGRKLLHRMTAERLDAMGFKPFKTIIRANVSLAEAPTAGTNIFDYAPRSNGAKDYAAFAEEYLKRYPMKHIKHNKK